MIRRAILVAGAAISLILAPSAAIAYAAYVPAGVSFPVTDAKPAAGVPFNVKASGAKANEAVTLTITREPSSGKPPAPVTKNADAKGAVSDAKGAVSFAVTLTDDGTYSLVSTSASGAVLGTQSVTVSDQGAVIVAGDSASASTSASVPAPGASAARAARAPAAGPPAPGVAAGGQLSFTGVRGMGLAVGGGGLVLAGAGFILVARRREMAQTSA